MPVVAHLKRLISDSLLLNFIFYLKQLNLFYVRTTYNVFIFSVYMFVGYTSGKLHGMLKKNEGSLLLTCKGGKELCLDKVMCGSLP